MTNILSVRKTWVESPEQKLTPKTLSVERLESDIDSFLLITASTDAQNDYNLWMPAWPTLPPEDASTALKAELITTFSTQPKPILRTRAHVTAAADCDIKHVRWDTMLERVRIIPSRWGGENEEEEATAEPPAKRIRLKFVCTSAGRA